MTSFSVARSIETKAAEVATRIDNEDFEKRLNTLIEAKTEDKLGALMVLSEIASTLGEDMETLPVPGSEENKVGQNEPFDRFKYTGSDGKQVQGSFYGTLAKSLKRGIQITQDITTLESKNTKPYTSEVEADLRMYRQRRQTLETVLRRAISLFKQIASIKELDGVDTGFKVNPDGTVQRNTFPMWVQDLRTAPPEVKRMSIGEYLALKPQYVRDPKNVAEHGNEYKALLASRKRSGDNTQATGFKIKTVKELIDVSLGVANYVDNRENYTALIATLGKKTKDSDELLITLVEMRDALSGLVDKYEERSEQLMAKKHTDVKDKAAA